MKPFEINPGRQQAIDLLAAQQCSCVIVNNGVYRSFWQRGVADLYTLLKEEPAFLKGAFIADKVVGKAAAALMVLGGVEALYTSVVSRPALDLLTRSGLAVASGVVVPHIINRAQTDWCPLEKRCFAAATPEECLEQIERFRAEQNAVKS